MDAAPDSGYATMQAENTLVKQQTAPSSVYVTASTAVSQPSTSAPTTTVAATAYYGGHQVVQVNEMQLMPSLFFFVSGI